MNLYFTDNHRNRSQLEEMQRLEKEGVCIFCPPHLAARDGQRIIHETRWWTITPNRYPYAGTKHHLLLVPSMHTNDILALPEMVRSDFWVALAWARDHYSITFYGLGIRCGSCEYTGGTIEHLHVHVIVGDVDNPDHLPVRLKVSSRPRDGDPTARG